MGKKKDKKAKKGKGAEKTAMKTERKADKKTKKILVEKGEDDIEALIAEFSAKDKKRQAVQEEKVEPPSPRSNFAMTPHPDREELIFFGGEYFNGAKTFMYNDLFFYNIKKQEWTQVKSPNPPPPRCAHQAVALSQGGGQLWVFGGEFASPSQSQFYHYKDLWLLNLKDKTWEKIKAPGGPSARSGHRMVVYKKNILIFGGFHDNIRDYKYYNDVHCFNLDTFTWSLVQPSGSGPSPRSACQMVATQDQRGVLIYGGYSKQRVKKDVDQGTIHTDMFLLLADTKQQATDGPLQWKWQAVRQHGTRPSQRCGFSMVPTPGNRALFFGGVFDEEEDEENVKGVFYNEMYSLELDKGTWHQIFLRGKKSSSERKKRRRKKANEEDNEGSSSEEMEEELEDLKVADPPAAAQTTFDDGIFSVSVGPQTSQPAAGCNPSGDVAGEVFMPCPRMNAVMTVRGGTLYLYGGVVEDGDRQLTLADMYSLDLHRLEEWTTLRPLDTRAMEWLDSDSDSDDSDDEGAAAGARAGKEDEDSDSEDSDSEEDMEEEVPDVKSAESVSDYFGRTRDYWLNQADAAASAEGVDMPWKQLKKQALALCEQHHQLQAKR